ncbi:MAG: SDR family NAD(P)-dependent oxidoreductase, partial [Gammaproteobacteria bacterium]
MSKPTALITGVGEGTGAALVRRFARGGYKIAMLARNQERLKLLEDEISDSKAYLCDVGNI